MAKKINKNPIYIIQSIIDRYQNSFKDIFEKLHNYEMQLTKLNGRHMFSVNDCKHILNTYQLNFPYYSYDTVIEVTSECLLLLYNWQKSKVIYNIHTNNIATNIPEFISPSMVKKFPYQCFYCDYKFSAHIYGAFITWYGFTEEFHFTRKILIGFIEWNPNDIWTIEPIEFQVKNNTSILDSIVNTMYKTANFNITKDSFMKNLISSSCLMIKIVSSIIDYYDLDSANKINHLSNKTPNQIEEYTANIDIIESNINLNKSKIKDYNYKEPNKKIKSTPKSPHPRRSHTRNIKIKDEYGNVIGYKVVHISSSYIHENDIKPINVKNIVK